MPGASKTAALTPDAIGPPGAHPLHVTGAGKLVAVAAGGAATAYDGALQTPQVWRQSEVEVTR